MKKILTRNESDLLTLLTDSGYSKTKAKQLVKHGAVAIGDKEATRVDQLVLAGELVCVRSEQEMREQAKTCPGLSIIYEDEAIIVIDKPAGLLTIATEKEKRKTAYYLLSTYLKERSKSTKSRIFIVHRLDQGTSGLLVFAKNEMVKQILQDNWEHADKRYTAIVEGIPREKEGQIASTLSESKALRVYSVRGTSEEGKEARTNYKVIKESDAYAWLDITLLTGRKNQIRVHMADHGYPIAGDKKYGAKTNPLRRMALHAYYLSFNHPTIPEKRMEFELPTPGKFYMLFSKKKER
ncbi:MAG: RluA family pseudouridine synthase [Proteobacteria bacterium]|jgi:RluA family pseudouridine synthase|nr:RluA family pseudouridine synthase [Desulfocapsa sp.]MBU3945395.1 RluA family pseudouridine synthase [Pseudomonadota bacterium]MCG2744151.1 RluA family pseudouridine synthase [Desulfobacteraceae bacterium]MDO8947477.1 RluA family pseudouridine synthase [Desulfocapsaceae bacterium]MBU3982977.1 RluA family pseudouridine synthase [Pseudomonadota bacterium]